MKVGVGVLFIWLAFITLLYFSSGYRWVFETYLTQAIRFPFLNSHLTPSQRFEKKWGKEKVAPFKPLIPFKKQAVTLYFPHPDTLRAHQLSSMADLVWATYQLYPARVLYIKKNPPATAIKLDTVYIQNLTFLIHHGTVQ